MGYYISKIFPDLHWVWNVYESSKVAAAYSSFRDFVLPKNIELNFISSDVLFSGNEGELAIDLILISCALQYFEEPYEILGRVFKNSAPKIMIRIPFVDLDYDIPVVQDFEKLGGYAGAKSVS